MSSSRADFIVSRTEILHGHGLLHMDTRLRGIILARVSVGRDIAVFC